MRPTLAVAITLALAGCSTGSPPDIHGLTDQTVAVGQELVLELDGTDADGDPLAYTVHADFMLMGATVTQMPSGAGLFRWTPLAEDVGSHTFDFTVSDGHNDTTVTITIDVVPATGAGPIFRQPLGTGTVVNVATTPCMSVDVVIDDSTATQVTIAQEAPLIDGAMLQIVDGLDATWTWCPTAAQVAASDRYTLILSADDGSNPKVLKDYVIVLDQGTAGGGLVINEVDYDQVGTDYYEYVEIYNSSSAPKSLAGLALVLVNGATNTTYDTVDLSTAGQLASQQYLVVGTVTVPASALHIDPLWISDRVQNGAPDGLALIDNVTYVVIDALSYEGSITAATINGFAMPVSLVEGTPLDPAVADSNTQDGTLCRDPNGQDTNNAATDWKFCTTITVGTANVP